MPLAQQIVQVGHVCLEAGRVFDWYDTPSNLVLLAVATQFDLQVAIERLQLAEIRITTFHEPDFNLGMTAACTEPVVGAIRHVFRRFSLWDARQVLVLPIVSDFLKT
ncbi:MAG: hypothetical protein HY862_18565 [Chloroflexi bacterium]|nr:hypothetical protein [Chloroflexota bacterium]